MTTKQPKDGWSWFAMAGALNYQGERQADAVAAGEKALALLPGNADAVWIRAQTLANDEKTRDEAIAFVDSQRPRLRNPANIIVTKGYALYSQSAGPKRDEAKLTAAFAAFEEARRIDPANLSAWYLPGSYPERPATKRRGVSPVEESGGIRPRTLSTCVRRSGEQSTKVVSVARTESSRRSARRSPPF